MTTEFTDLSLHSQLVQTLAELGYTTPTPIQTALIPTMLTGQDVIGQAQTGTGKTAAFALPMLHNLVAGQGYVQGLVLAPTRELAIQVAEAVKTYGQRLNVQVLAVYGGQPYGYQLSSLRKGVDIVIGTPGRLLDLIKRKALDLSFVSTVVLDEADEMLSMGFIEDIESILKNTPVDRQTALFSATLPREIRRLAESYMQSPQSFTIERKQLTVETIEQRYYLVNQSDKMAALTRLFEVEEITSALIFSRTRAGTGELAAELTVRGFPAEALNGDMSQDERERVLNRFRRNQIKVLVGTDVAARGLDIDDISHVFNYDLPQDPEVYVHRVGRTGRAGKTGIAITLLTPKEQGRMRRIEGFIRQKIAQLTLPSVEDIQNRRDAELVRNVKVWLERNRCSREREMVAELIEAGYDAVDIAAVALKLSRAQEKKRPIAGVSEVKAEYSSGKKFTERRGSGRGERSRYNDRNEEGMVRLSLDSGDTAGIRVNHIVRMLAEHTNMPGRSIGKISIQRQHTLVDVPEQFVDQVLAKAGRYRIGRNRISVERA